MGKGFATRAAMRFPRHLLLLALLAPAALPTAAGAQTLTVTGTTAFGSADCAAGSTASVQLQSATVSSVSTPTIALFASTAACPGLGSTDSTVTVPKDALVLVSQRSVTTADASGTTVAVKVKDLAGGDCSSSLQTTWNLCLYEFWQTQTFIGAAATNVNRGATAILKYDSKAPGVPRLDSVSSGDGNLRVSGTAPGDDDFDHFEVLIRAVETSLADFPDGGADTTASSSSSSTGTTGSSSSSSSSSGTTGSGSSSGSTGTSSSSSSSTGTTGYDASPCIEGAVITTLASGELGGRAPDDASEKLTNGRLYEVQLRALDAAGNRSGCSNPLQGTPEEVDDFWRSYRRANGQTAGCSQPGPALPLLATLATAFALSRGLRRKEHR